MEDFENGLREAWTSVGNFLPKFIGFLVILLIGYFVAKALEKIVDKVLERVGFDRWVERGGVKRALSQSKYDASSLLGRVVFFMVMLFTLQLAFGVFGPNPISELIQGAIAYLPNVFAAILIIVIGAAIAAGVKEIVQSSLGGLDYGRGLAIAAGTAIMVLTVFAALDQLNVAPTIVTGMFYALLLIVVGSAVVAIGGGGIPTMRRYWERAASRAEMESINMRAEMRQTRGAREPMQRRLDEERIRQSGAPVDTTGSPDTVDLREEEEATRRRTLE